MLSWGIPSNHVNYKQGLNGEYVMQYFDKIKTFPDEDSAYSFIVQWYSSDFEKYHIIKVLNGLYWQYIIEIS